MVCAQAAENYQVAFLFFVLHLLFVSRVGASCKPAQQTQVAKGKWDRQFLCNFWGIDWSCASAVMACYTLFQVFRVPRCLNSRLISLYYISVVQLRWRGEAGVNQLWFSVSCWDLHRERGAAAAARGDQKSQKNVTPVIAPVSICAIASLHPSLLFSPTSLSSSLEEEKVESLFPPVPCLSKLSAY